ncbi:MAG TPA: M12 family metallo-peptidase [Chloroflexota bacterium]|nr:M12 family metallo-peptidase [Chloroflexota bacterium]
MRVSRAPVVFAVVALAILVAAIGPSLVVQPASAQNGLFSDATRQPDVPLVVPRPVVRQRLVDVNFALLDSAARAGVGSALTLNLFNSAGALYPEIIVAATRDRVERTSSGQGIIWVGKVPGDLGSQVTLVSERGALAGDIRTGGRLYHIRSLGQGVHAIDELNPGAFPPDDHLLPGGVRLGGGASAARAAVAAAIASRAGASPSDASVAAPAAAAPPPTTAADDGLTVDFMVVYTPAAAAENGGTAGMDTQVDLAIADVNGAYANSAVNFRARLVYKGQVNYTESGDISTDLNALTAGNISNGSQTVAALRNQFGADLVSLITREDPFFCGIGWIMNPAGASFASNAFSVVAGTSCAVSNHSLAHETGHNMGLCHDWIQNDCTPQVPWGHGYVDPQNRFRDIMSYPQSCGNCQRIQYFSNLVTTYLGNPVGTAHNLPNPADNTALLNANASIIANWRQCVVAPCSGQQPPATPTSAPIPTPVVSCSPRPRVSVSTQPAGSNTLQVTLLPGANGWINQVQIGAAVNARIDIAGLTGITGNQTITLPPATTSLTFQVHHLVNGQATTVPLTVVDTCGSWPTFVGGGASAF